MTMGNREKTKRRKYRFRISIFVLAVLLAFGATGCSSGASKDAGSALKNQTAEGNGAAAGSSDADTKPSAGEAKSAAKQSESAQTVPSVQAGIAGTQPSDGINRKLIYKANLSMEVDDYEAVQAEVRSRVAEAGGYILTFNEQKRDGRWFGIFTVKVPAAGLSSLLDKLDAIPGENKKRSVKGEDFSEEYVDLEARLKAKQAVEARLLSFLERATKTDELVSFSTELGKVQEEIEKLKGRIRYIDQNVALSTLEIELAQKGSPAFVQSEGDKGLWESMKSSFQTSVRFLSRAGKAVLVFLTGFIPIAAAGAVILLPTLYAVKWWRKRTGS